MGPNSVLYFCLESEVWGMVSPLTETKRVGSAGFVKEGWKSCLKYQPSALLAYYVIKRTFSGRQFSIMQNSLTKHSVERSVGTERARSILKTSTSKDRPLRTQESSLQVQDAECVNSPCQHHIHSESHGKNGKKYPQTQTSLRSLFGKLEWQA